jgi:hypothetical protein
VSLFTNQVPGAVPPVDTLQQVKVTSLHGCSVRFTAVNLAPDVIMEPRISEETDQWCQPVERIQIVKDRCLLQYNSPYVVARLATCQKEERNSSIIQCSDHVMSPVTLLIVPGHEVGHSSPSISILRMCGAVSKLPLTSSWRRN